MKKNAPKCKDFCLKICLIFEKLLILAKIIDISGEKRSFHYSFKNDYNGKRTFH